MKTVAFDTEVLIGDASITEIKVAPISFVELGTLWRAIDVKSAKPEVALQRARIKHQTHFVGAEGKRVMPDDRDIQKLPISVARGIITELDEGQGTAGKLLNDGNGITAPVHYKLGNPIPMSGGKVAEISELEFKASTYGEVEDVLAAENSIEQTIEMLRRIAKPVEVASLTTLPSWAVDRISVADGVTISKLILPRFLS